MGYFLIGIGIFLIILATADMFEGEADLLYTNTMDRIEKRDHPYLFWICIIAYFFAGISAIGFGMYLLFG